MKTSATLQANISALKRLSETQEHAKIELGFTREQLSRLKDQEASASQNQTALQQQLLAPNELFQNTNRLFQNVIGNDRAHWILKAYAKELSEYFSDFRHQPNPNIEQGRDNIQEELDGIGAQLAKLKTQVDQTQTRYRQQEVALRSAQNAKLIVESISFLQKEKTPQSDVHIAATASNLAKMYYRIEKLSDNPAPALKTLVAELQQNVEGVAGPLKQVVTDWIEQQTSIAKLQDLQRAIPDFPQSYTIHERIDNKITELQKSIES